MDLSWNAPNCLNFSSMFQSSTAFNRAMPNLIDTSGIIVGTTVTLASMFQTATIHICTHTHTNTFVFISTISKIIYIFLFLFIITKQKRKLNEKFLCNFV